MIPTAFGLSLWYNRRLPDRYVRTYRFCEPAFFRCDNAHRVFMGFSKSRTNTAVDSNESIIYTRHKNNRKKGVRTPHYLLDCCARNDIDAKTLSLYPFSTNKKRGYAPFLFNPCAYDRCMFSVASADFMMRCVAINFNINFNLWRVGIDFFFEI